MVYSLEQMRALVKEHDEEATKNKSGNNDIFNFGDVKVGSEIRLRFVEDKDPTNPFFWRQRNVRTLKFDSIKLLSGEVENKPVYVSVPAFNLKANESSIDNLPQEYLYKSTEDVIHQKIKGFWVVGDNASQELYKKFGKKTTHIFQGFVRSPNYEVKLYRFLVTNELANLIMSFMNDSEITSNPCDTENGRDFILRVSEKTANIRGSTQKTRDYITNSKWSNNSSPLTQEERAYLQENGLFDLKNFISKRPTAAQEKVMLEMYNASYDGMPYDVKEWSGTFKPSNVWLDENGVAHFREDNHLSKVPTELPEQKKVVLQDSPMVQSQPVQSVQNLNVSQLTKNVTQTIDEQSTQETIDSIMSKLSLGN